MSNLEQIGIAIGGVLVGIGGALAEVFRRKRRAPAPELPEDSVPLASRVGRLTDRVIKVEQEIAMLRQTVGQKLDQLEGSVDELCAARVRTDELLPLIREQLKEIREDLRDERRRNPHKE